MKIGYDENKNGEDQISKPRKEFNDINNNILAKDTTKYTYGLIYHIVELCNNIQDENLISLLLPILYYFKEYSNISGYIISTYKQFKDKMISFYKTLNILYERLLTESNKNVEEIEKLVQTQFLTTDKQIIGFVPYKLYFEKNKKGFTSTISQDLQFLCKVFLIKSYLKELKLDSIETSVINIIKL